MKLPAEESDQIKASFRLLSELLEKEGWTEYSDASSFRGDEKSYTIRLDQTELTLSVQKSGEILSGKLTPSGPALPEQEVVLAEFDAQWKSVDKQTYYQFIDNPERTSTSQ